MGRKKAAKGKLLVVSGFSGVGKGTVIRNLMTKFPNYVFSVSATTRAPRPGEVDGRDYFFIDTATFDAWVEEGRFLEYARFFGRSYGTLKDHVEDLRSRGKTVILDIEVEGAGNVCRLCPDAVSVYIIPPSAGELRDRLVGRGTESREQIMRRMTKAVAEASVVSNYRYLVVNDVAEEAAAEIDRLVRGVGGPRLEREKALKLTAEVQEDLQEILKDWQACDNINSCIQD